MASVHQPAAAGTDSAAAPISSGAGSDGDEATAAVNAAFQGLGAPVDCTNLRSLPLEGPQVMWHVVDGAMDLFAVDAVYSGHWHFLGRVTAGTLVMGPVAGPQHTVVARPLQDCVLRRIELLELYKPEGAPAGVEDPAMFETIGANLSALERAFARGVGRGLRVLFEAPLDGNPATQEVLEDDILWMPVAPNSVRYGAEFDQNSPDLLVDGEMWQRMVSQQHRLLSALDRWIERLERAHEDRTAAGLEAGESVRAQADQALVASIGTRKGAASAQASDDDTLTVCRMVAEAEGIVLSAPKESGRRDERQSPIDRIAASSRIRTRVVKLSGEWWKQNTGPLVGYWEDGTPMALLWRRGQYWATDADGEVTRITQGNVSYFEPRAVMLYRPLPSQPLSPLRLLRFATHGIRPDMRNLLLAGAVNVIMGALVPLATGQVLGTYVRNAQKDLIVQVSLAVMLSAVVSAAFMLLENLAVLRIEGRIESKLQPAIWDRLLRLPTKFFAQRSTGELAQAAMGISQMRRLISGVGPVALQAATVGAMNVVMLLAFSVSLAGIAMLMLVVISAVFLGMGLWQLRWQRRLIVLTNKLNNQAFQTLRGLPKLRVAAAESFAYAAWAQEFARSRELQQKVGRIKNATMVVNAVYLPVCTLLMFMLLAGPAKGTLSSSAFLTFNTSVTMVLTSVTQLTNAFVSAAAALPMFEQIKPVLQERPEVRPESTQPGELMGELGARGLSFRYAEDGPLVLDDVSFSVQAGEFVAIVGASGCGKSTLLRLLIGFNKPDSGSVLYDGQDLAALDQAAVRRQCGVVLQNAQPFNGTILDSICGAEVFTQEEAWEAAEMAGLADDIKAMPMGMHTMLSDGGGTISGGQRQRLMIAQALIRRPRILFFDEATSALDNETQRIVIESTRRLQCTRIVIAHRLTTVMDADRVLVMSDGRIVQQGRPADLLEDTQGELHQLVKRQMQ